MNYDSLGLVDEEQKKAIIEEIIYFFKTDREEEIGIIGAESIYNFMVESIGNRIYNKALDNAFRHYKKYEENMESDYYSLYKSTD